jgi:hypothetical protein
MNLADVWNQVDQLDELRKAAREELGKRDCKSTAVSGGPKWEELGETAKDRHRDIGEIKYLKRIFETNGEQ